MTIANILVVFVTTIFRFISKMQFLISVVVNLLIRRDVFVFLLHQSKCWKIEDDLNKN